jgi:hypothetical protein
MLFVYMLLFLLAGSVLLGILRVLKGGSFLPEPGEDHLFRDNKSRWWREDATGTIEEAFRRQPGKSYAIKSWVLGVIRSYVTLLLWIAGATGFFGSLWLLSSMAAAAGIPEWLPWVAGGVAYLTILRWGKRRGRFRSANRLRRPESERKSKKQESKSHG